MIPLKLRSHQLIPNPADPLGPALAAIAWIRGGEVEIIMRGPHDSIEDVLAEARRLDKERRAKRRHHNRLDRLPRLGEDSQ